MNTSVSLILSHTLALGMPAVLVVFSLWSLLQVGRQRGPLPANIMWALVLGFVNALAVVWFSAVSSQFVSNETLHPEVLRSSSEFGIALFLVLAAPLLLRWVLFRRATHGLDCPLKKDSAGFKKSKPRTT